MRPIYGALLLSAALVPAASAGEPRTFEDAPLHAIQFVDDSEGWAVGDEGVIWHSIDGGKNWERQPTGVRASLRSLHFLTPFMGWVAGREELPNGGGSSGVLLFTRNGGIKWELVSRNALPGLNYVHFLDKEGGYRTGYAVGDGSDQFPSSVFVTTDSGRSWQPLPGPRCPAWLSADFQDAKTGSLVGAWSPLGLLRNGKVTPASKSEIDQLGPRALRGLRLQGKAGIAVGQGGLILLKDDQPGAVWSIADLKLKSEVQANLDFHAVHGVGKHVWVVGRPGSVMLHSATLGNSWEMVPTGQALPLNGVFFLDEKTGWAVGEFGAIVATTDGGKTWRVQRRGGQRAALLFIHARAVGLPADTLALLGGEEGYLTAALRVAGPDPASAAPVRASDAQRFSAAVREAAGAAGEMLWQFPVPQHLLRCEPPELMKAWDRLHADRAADQLLRQLVLTIRIWRPDVVITDPPLVPKQESGNQGADAASETVVSEAVREAFKRAGDPKAFPEQITELGLEGWKPSKLYARWDSKAKAQVILDLTEASRRLESSARDFAGPALALLSEAPSPVPAQRYFRLLDSRIDGADGHSSLLEGLPPLAPGGLARRNLPPLKEPTADIIKAIQARRNLQTLAETPPGGIVSAEKLLAQIGPTLDHLPDHHAAPAALAVANAYARQGQWGLARETFLLMLQRYPADPLTADACRWLIRHNSSSEAMRRYDLKQFVVDTLVGFETKPAAGSGPNEEPASGGRQTPEKLAPPASGDRQRPEKPAPSRSGERQPPEKSAAPKGAGTARPKVALPDIVGKAAQLRYSPSGGGAAAREWFKGSLELEPRLAALGPLHASDPSIQFCLQAARRNMGEFEKASKWYADFASRQPDGPWKSAALAELWLLNRAGPPPKPVAICRYTDTRPLLDGRLEESCWKETKPLVLRNIVGKTVKDKPDEDLAEEYATEAWLAYDQDFLYLALRCRHPANRYVAPVKVRPRDADLRPYDRVSLLIDLDRDYSTYYHLQVDQRGCVCDDCWGDLSWNPRWFVAVKSDKTCWRIEAAIPLAELTGQKITAGQTWACNIIRVLPGRGVQAFSAPADVQPRPEGMGLLMFAHDAKP
jgi:photosystem II stability/assembly factor-like uncharacterized protein